MPLPAAAPTLVAASVAAGWIDRWDRQHQHYALDRNARAQVVAEVVEHAVKGRETPLVVNLGSGPGSLARILAEQMPAAEVVAVDYDRFYWHSALHVTVTESATSALGWAALARRKRWQGGDAGTPPSPGAMPASAMSALSGASAPAVSSWPSADCLPSYVRGRRQTVCQVQLEHPDGYVGRGGE